ncbi:MAG: hypothetical protein GXO07_04835 [Crenarchaeota archaeon]|nr:hypothetical protein [Thermoproteota archaeon]
MKGVIVSYDGTKYCYMVLDDEGKELERICCEEARQVEINARCTLEGYPERPGFVARCRGTARCEGARLVVST